METQADTKQKRLNRTTNSGGGCKLRAPIHEWRATTKFEEKLIFSQYATEFVFCPVQGDCYSMLVAKQKIHLDLRL